MVPQNGQAFSSACFKARNSSSNLNTGIDLKRRVMFTARHSKKRNTSQIATNIDHTDLGCDWASSQPVIDMIPKRMHQAHAHTISAPVLSLGSSEQTEHRQMRPNPRGIKGRKKMW
jgi:hypothetical protein